MKYLHVPDSKPRILPFYLAMEEYAARELQEDVFFAWQVEPTVIFGRHQVMGSEVDVDYCRRHGIAFYRRRSGGGCVYADRDNLMMSCVTQSGEVEQVFARYTARVVQMLRSLGLDATASQRNDILIDGRKVSGNAFYQTAGRCIVHGTMLFDTNMEHMLGALTPAADKLKSKGVASVRSRITTLREHLDIGLEAFKRHVRETMCDGDLRLGPEEVGKIERLAQAYLDPQFLQGNDPHHTVEHARRIEGVGLLGVSLDLRHGRIADLRLTGDFLPLCDAREAMLERLQAVRPEAKELGRALEGCDAGRWILNLGNRELISLLNYY